MAGGQERILRQRIKSVQATRKITKAMELIAASQISRSQARITANRPYRAGMRRVIVEAALGDPKKAAEMASNPLGPLPKDADAVELAAWTTVANVLLNLDETLMKR